MRPHLVVANRVPKAVRGEPFFWVEQDEVRGGDGAKHLGARIGADGYSESVEDVRIEHVLLALDRAERELALESEGMAATAEPWVAQA